MIEFTEETWQPKTFADLARTIELIRDSALETRPGSLTTETSVYDDGITFRLINHYLDSENTFHVHPTKLGKLKITSWVRFPLKQELATIGRLDGLGVTAVDIYDQMKRGAPDWQLESRNVKDLEELTAMIAIMIVHSFEDMDPPVIQ